MKNLFSINKTADLLERDRATLVRALRRVKADGELRGRYRMRTITDALAAQEVRNNVSTRGGAYRLRSRLGEIADELEQTHKELDAKRELIKVQPTLDAKQPYSRAAMKVFEPLRDLYALACGAAESKAGDAPGGALETGLQSPNYRTGWSLCDGIKFLEGGCPS
ncbi:hypothetical protein [Bradyrhizobium sp. 30]|uniref:hypothetical protein n=1 Tax=Bradyrhizobium sp. 30 TaxID=2782669 RepID=UPI001FF778E8|nr:hypothetical protein [Bradyrhizobium sp. 30]MCK1289922.1 hypothetical protein [Bradyrhizobium sp. 30]